jgi:hypothetical protein
MGLSLLSFFAFFLISTSKGPSNAKANNTQTSGDCDGINTVSRAAPAVPTARGKKNLLSKISFEWDIHGEALVWHRYSRPIGNLVECIGIHLGGTTR